MSDFDLGDLDDAYVTKSNGKRALAVDGGGTGVDVNIQSQTNQLFQYFLIDEQKTDVELAAPISTDDTQIQLVAGHGFTAAPGEVIVVREGDAFAQLEVISVATNTITVDLPIAQDFPIDSGVIRGNKYLNVDGSVTPIEFRCGFAFAGSVGAVVPVDISQIDMTMVHSAQADDGKFGGIAALPKGLFFRKVNDVYVNLGNYQSNQKFREYGGIVTYNDNAPTGSYGTNIIFPIELVFKQVIRLDPRVPDCLFATNRDDITGLEYFTVSLIGSFTSGE